ncbi:DUF2249 domain-containing protein [Pontibacter pamirensis]|uniref:DUF2249 domain-containing protein n=1 Tax=Pontibacter pamirensis TaxID=2562824 RepID=UPI001F453332|nr:DUF2249 domain-containing protein [Pontibacter pamirensis]
MCTVEELDGTNVLLLVNTFEPTPLISILARRGYACYSEVRGPDLVHSYFWPKGEEREAKAETAIRESVATEKTFEELLTQFDVVLKHVDVRHLEMPQPMVTILNELEQLPSGEVLYVTHRRVPQFLLPRLEERGFVLASKAIAPEEVHLIIYKQT